MAREAKKKSTKPEIEILPVPEGVTAVDEWGAVYEYEDSDGEPYEKPVLVGWDIPLEDQVFKAYEKSIVINFENYFKIPNTLDKFFLQYKDSYVSKLNLITHYINYFIKFYDLFLVTFQMFVSVLQFICQRDKRLIHSFYF